MEFHKNMGSTKLPRIPESWFRDTANGAPPDTELGPLGPHWLDAYAIWGRYTALSGVAFPISLLVLDEAEYV
jgi:hypothetical protein